MFLVLYSVNVISGMSDHIKGVIVYGHFCITDQQIPIDQSTVRIRRFYFFFFFGKIIFSKQLEYFLEFQLTFWHRFDEKKRRKKFWLELLVFIYFI